jgi:hypothetical protein
MTFVMKTSETKKSVKMFCEVFLILQQYFASTIQDFFFVLFFFSFFLQKKAF